MTPWSEQGSIFQTTSDTEVLLHLYARSKAPTVEQALIESVTQAQGAFSLVLLTKDRLIAVRDPHGFRPLTLGRLGDAYIVCSETCALDLIDAQWIRDIEPGEMLVIGPEGALVSSVSAGAARRTAFSSTCTSRGRTPTCSARASTRCEPNSGGCWRASTRSPADVVVPIPDSGVCAATGFAEASGMPLRMGLIRNHYVGRTFIEPHQSIRHFGVRVKLNPVKSILQGRRVVLVDDSIVRGTTSRKIVKMVRAAGASEVHMRISCPPTISPCFYGVDTPRRAELIAATHSLEEIRRYIGADSLGYLSLEGLLAAGGTGARVVLHVVLHGRVSRRVSAERGGVPAVGAQARRMTPRRGSRLPSLIGAVPGSGADRTQRSPPPPPAEVSGGHRSARRLRLLRPHGSRARVRRAQPAAGSPRSPRRCASHADGYVRYRALVLLGGFGEAAAARRHARRAGGPERSAAHGGLRSGSNTIPIPACFRALIAALAELSDRSSSVRRSTRAHRRAWRPTLGRARCCCRWSCVVRTSFAAR